MNESSYAFKLLGPFGTPIGIVFSLLLLIATFRSYGETIGWKVVLPIVFLVSLVWSIWYRRAMTTNDVGLAGVDARKVYRHQSKLWRRVVLVFPIVTGMVTSALLIATLFQPRKTNYSSLLQGGGPFTPMVVFDSSPPGAEVRIAKFYYADDDPWLLSKDEDKVARLPEHT